MYILSFDIGIKNLAYCLLHKETEQIIDLKVVDISARTYDKQCQILIDKLELITIPNNHVIVVIEKQPGCNPKMRIISGQIFMYFALKKKLNCISKVVYYSAKHKLKCYTGEFIAKKTYSTKYAQRKYLSKEHCRLLMDETNQDILWKHIFETTKKADDIADAFLQGLAYIRGFN